jgi:hypothetical protein
MRNQERVLALALAGAVVVGTPTTSRTAPVPANTIAVKSATTPGDVIDVRWRGGGWRGGWRGPFIGGVILGGAIAAPYYYGYPYAYGYEAPYWGYAYYPSSSVCFEGTWRRRVPCNLP